jgi:hypothetical protein
MDLWAHCGDCDRWFYCEHGAAERATCPVCAATAARVVERDETRLLGRADAARNRGT